MPRARSRSTVEQRTPSYMALPCTRPRASAARFDRAVIRVQNVIGTKGEGFKVSPEGEAQSSCCREASFF